MPVRPPAAAFPFPASAPPERGRERLVTDILLTAGVRALVFIVALGLLAQMTPKRVWSKVLDANNTAVAIVMAAIVLALALVIAAPLG